MLLLGAGSAFLGTWTWDMHISTLETRMLSDGIVFFMAEHSCLFDVSMTGEAYGRYVHARFLLRAIEWFSYIG